MLATQPSATNSPFGRAATITGTSGGQTLSSIALSNKATTTGLSSGTAIGTLSVTMSPVTPIFAGYASAGLSLAPTVAGCNGADNASFQIVNDQLQTNGVITAGTKNICVAATQAGAAGSPLKQNFVITVGNRFDAAASFCAANGGGDGSSGNPWKDACILAAVNAAADGDTVFLAAGNWQLRINTATPTGNVTNGVNTITGLSSTAGITVGESVGDITTLWPTANTLPGDPGQATQFPKVTAINGACGTNCVTLDKNARASASGHTFGFGFPVVTSKKINLVGAGSGNTFDAYGHPSNRIPGASGTNTRIYTSGTNLQYPGGFVEFITCSGSPGPSVSHIYFDGSNAIAGNTSDGGGDFSGALNFVNCENPLLNDIRVLNFNNALTNPNTHLFDFGSKNFVLKNSVVSESWTGPDYSGSVNLQDQFHDTSTLDNNLFYQQTYSGYFIDNITLTRNAMFTFNDATGRPTAILANGPEGCSPAGCYNGSTTGNFHYFARNNLFYALGQAFGLAPGVNDPSTNGIVSDIQYSGNWFMAGEALMSTCGWRFLASYCVPTGSPDTGNPSSAMQVNGLSYTNNSVFGTASAPIDLRGNGCGTNPANPGQGPAGCATVNSTQNWMTCNNCSATQNYLSGPSNQYLTDAHSISPSQSNNYCTGSSFTGCNTTGFTASPTATFTLSPLGLGGIVLFSTENFTAQYGAVQWLASTSSTPPLANDPRWSSNNSGFPNGGLNTYVPPVSLSGVSHGSTVYLWDMDSAQHIAAAAPQVVP
jgi:hypothetical protein